MGQTASSMAKKISMERSAKMREKIVIISLVSIICVLWTIKQELSSSLYIQSDKLINIQNQAASIQSENNNLELELLNKESYHNIFVQAQRQGYVPANYLYMK